jgi:hypothetical protein
MRRQGNAACSIERRVSELPWPALHAGLEDLGVALTPTILTPSECREIAGFYDRDELFARPSTALGSARPVPVLRSTHSEIVLLRSAFSHPADRSRWAERCRRPAPWRDELGEWLEQCHDGGQTRPASAAPLRARRLERSAPGLYGDLVFPLRSSMVSTLGCRLHGGEFVVVEQRPRAQSRAPRCRSTKVGIGSPPATARVSRGWSAPMRHGLSMLRPAVDTLGPCSTTRSDTAPEKSSWRLIGADGLPTAATVRARSEVEDPHLAVSTPRRPSGALPRRLSTKPRVLRRRSAPRRRPATSRAPLPACRVCAVEGRWQDHETGPSPER